MLALAVLREVPRRVRAGRWEVDERGRSLYGAERGDRRVRAASRRSSCACCEPFGVRATVVRRRDEPVAGAARTVTVERLGDALGHAPRSCSSPLR